MSLVYSDAQSYPGVLWWVLGHSFSVTKPWSELPSQRVLERVLHICQTQVQWDLGHSQCPSSDLSLFAPIGS